MNFNFNYKIFKAWKNRRTACGWQERYTWNVSRWYDSTDLTWIHILRYCHGKRIDGNDFWKTCSTLQVEWKISCMELSSSLRMDFQDVWATLQLATTVSTSRWWLKLLREPTSPLVLNRFRFRFQIEIRKFISLCEIVSNFSVFLFLEMTSMFDWYRDKIRS